MPPVPVVKQTEVRKAFERAGFRFVKQEGSHVKMRRDDVSVALPQHKGRDMPPGTLRGILTQANMTVEEFKEWLRA